MKNKSGMTVAEFLFALLICGVILSLAISLFRAQDLVRTPFIYSIMNNLPIINTAVQDDCYKDGTCSKQKQLPTSTPEYCLRLVNNLTTVGSVDCNPGKVENIEEDPEAENNGGDDDDKPENSKQENFRTMGNYDYFYNFRLTNGITFFGITHQRTNDTDSEGQWQEIEVNGTKYPNKYIDVLIDINGDNGNNAFGDDVFPIRIFQNGDVVPGFSNAATTVQINGNNTVVPTKNYFDDSEFFGYIVWLNTYANDSLKSYGVDLRTNEERADDSAANAKSFTKLDKVSFRRAVCAAFNTDKAADILNRYYGDTTENVKNNWCGTGNDTFDQSPNCICADEVSATAEGNDPPSCASNNSLFNNVNAAHCTVENAKPKGSGLLQLIGF